MSEYVATASTVISTTAEASVVIDRSLVWTLTGLRCDSHPLGPRRLGGRVLCPCLRRDPYSSPRQDLPDIVGGVGGGGVTQFGRGTRLTRGGTYPPPPLPPPGIPPPPLPPHPASVKAAITIAYKKNRFIVHVVSSPLIDKL